MRFRNAGQPDDEDTRQSGAPSAFRANPCGHSLCQSPDRSTVLGAIQRNQHIKTILSRLAEIRFDAWLASGCLAQTVWNAKTCRPATYGIKDYDLIYYDADQSWSAEDAVIRRTAALFSDLPVEVQVRNQARVPLWYRDKFGVDYPPVCKAPHALLRYPSRITAIALTRHRSGRIVLYAPFGFKDTVDMRVRPNKRLAIPDVYRAKTERWLALWPELSVEPWEVHS